MCLVVLYLHQTKSKRMFVYDALYHSMHKAYIIMAASWHAQGLHLPAQLHRDMAVLHTWLDVCRP
jgi:hypothetical protein